MTSKDGISSDERFSRIGKDPRFREMPDKEKKIKIDKRFQAMFHDKKFSLKYTVDKRGRPINHNTTEDLKRFYELSDSDEDGDAVSDTKKGKQKTKTKKKAELEPKEKPAKVQKEKKKTQSTDDTSDVNDNKKVKATTQSKDIKKGKDKAPKTKEKPPASVKTSKTSVKVMEQEESDESGLDAENEEGSDDEIGSEEDVSDGAGMCGEEESDEASQGESEESEEDEGASSDEEEDSDSGPDLARGKGNIETSSEDEDDDDDDDVDMGGLTKKDVEIEHAWREMDKDAPRGDQITRRLAICNMDWDRLKAKDLLALLNSFKPKGGIVFSVKIYPSEFGKQRLKEEELHGPVELRNVSEEDAAEYKIYKEKLRDYQFKRLKYFYAVVECDTPETANVLYEACDGLEFESSCSFVDLRFIPDDVQFDDEPKDSAVDVDLSAYKPKYFTSSAMVTSKIELTWDETDQDRVATLNRPFNKDEVLDMDFQAYLASSSEEEEEEEEEGIPDNKSCAVTGDAKSKKAPKDDDEQIAQYRELLKGIQEKEKRQEDKNLEMEVKWVPGLKENAEQMVKNKLEGRDKMTPWEKYLQKQKDKKKMKKRKKQETTEEANDDDDEVPSDVDFNDPFFAEELKKPGLKTKSAGRKKVGEQASSGDEEEKEKQKAQLSLLMMDEDDDDGRKHFNYDAIVERQNLSRRKLKKLKNKDELLDDDFQINVEDSRFQALYTSHLYNVDPSDPNYKKTKAMQRVLDEKARRREQEHKNYTETVKKQKATVEAAGKAGTSAPKTVDPALSSLLKSVKNKTQQFQAAKKQKTK